MDAQSARRPLDGPVIRIGMLTPSSNTVLEPVTSALLAPLSDRVSFHVSRFRVTQIGVDTDANRQLDHGAIVSAAGLLGDAKASVIAWNGTSASWLGFETDESLCAAIEQHTGVSATSAILTLNAMLFSRGVKRLGLVTPYTADVEGRIMANYSDVGIDVVAQARCDLRDNYSFAEVSEPTIEAMCRHVADARPEAIAIVCTNLRGPFVAARLERELKIPVLDSIAVTLKGCLDAVGVEADALAQFGSVFSETGQAG
jgi:maleate isomerase